jgi:hypothetical protein
VGVGPLLEVRAKGRDCLREAAHPAEQEPAIATVLRVGRFEDEQQVDRIDRGRPVPPGEPRRLEVAQHPGEDLAAAGRAEHPDVEEHAVPDRAPDQGLAVIRGQCPATVGRIDQEPVGTSDDEMAGQPDPGKGQPKTRGDLDLDDREADRQPDPAPEDLVELAVGRIAVLGGARPAEAELAVQDVVEAGNDRRDRIAGVEADPDSLRDRIELGQDRFLGDRRPTVSGDQEGAEGEIDLRLRSGDQAGKVRADGRPTIVEPCALVVHSWDSRQPRQSPAVRRRSGPRRGRARGSLGHRAVGS